MSAECESNCFQELCLKLERVGRIPITKIGKCDKCWFWSDRKILYGPYGAEITTRCLPHKDPEHINTQIMYCQYGSCSCVATCTLDGHLRPVLCEEHGEQFKKDSIVNKVKKIDDQSLQVEKSITPKDSKILCQIEGCDKQAVYGKVWRNPTHCWNHKESYMKRCVGQLCKMENCEKPASFGIEPLKPVYCTDHRTEKMVYVAYKKCMIENCRQGATSNRIGLKPEFCYDHKPPGCVYNPYRICITEGCTKPSICGKTKPFDILHCESHRQRDEVRHIKTPCLSCGLVEILNLEGFCEFCDPRKQRYNRRPEIIIKRLLDENGFRYLSHDKKIAHGRGERPDFLFECPHHYVILEVDENQHDSYDKKAEIDRMLGISRDLGIKTVFIRFNPDEYTMRENVDRRYHIDFEDRMRHLFGTLNYNMKKEPDHYCTVIYMYYDYVGGNPRIVNLDPEG